MLSSIKIPQTVAAMQIRVRSRSEVERVRPANLQQLDSIISASSSFHFCKPFQRNYFQEKLSSAVTIIFSPSLISTKKVISFIGPF